jgi:hypothetical protein
MRLSLSHEKRSKTIGGPPEGGERRRSVAQPEVIVREPWKTGMIPRRIVSEAFLDAREYRAIPRNPDALKRILEPEGEQHEV